MAINYRIWGFPLTAIQSQLFYVPGAYFDGNMTSGGARILSPEPGGRSVLEVMPSMQVNEWNSPLASWLMSKTNGEIFRVPLVKTPQLVSLVGETNYPIVKSTVKWDNDEFWDNGKPWLNDGAYLDATEVSLEGSVFLSVETSTFGQVIKHGHVIGFKNSSYMVEDIEYNGTIARITVQPPLRDSIAEGDMILLKPDFLGIIANGSEIRNTYDISKMGSVELNRIIFHEVIL